MNKNIKLSVTSLFLTVFVSACNSSASDAKKVELKPAATPSTETAPAPVEAKADAEAVSEKPLAVGDYVEGKHYVKISPELQTDVASGKVEVAELFWLGCSHCYSLEPEIIKYKKSLPEHVEFKQIPAMLNPSWVAEANTFFVSEILDPKGSKDLTTKLFDAIHKEKRQLRSPKAVSRFFVEQGYTEEQVTNAKNSLAFQTKLVRAQEFGVKSQANSVPSIVVNGKYRTSPSMAGGNANLMNVVNFLTDKENEAK